MLVFSHYIHFPFLSNFFFFFNITTFLFILNKKANIENKIPDFVSRIIYDWYPGEDSKRSPTLLPHSSILFRSGNCLSCLERYSKQKPLWEWLMICLVPSRRLERLTYGLEGSCSIQLSYEGKFAKRLYIILKLDIFFKFYLLIPS